jgi:heat shock protein HslJ
VPRTAGSGPGAWRERQHHGAGRTRTAEVTSSTVGRFYASECTQAGFSLDDRCSHAWMRWRKPETRRWWRDAAAHAGSWRGSRLDGNGASPRSAEPPPRPETAANLPTLTFSDADNKVSGFAGCNRLAGTYEAKGDSLRIGPLALTRMACPSGMELETKFGAALDATRRLPDHGKPARSRGRNRRRGEPGSKMMT